MCAQQVETLILIEVDVKFDNNEALCTFMELSLPYEIRIDSEIVN